MNAISIRTVEPSKAQLSKADWIRASLHCLIEQGIDAVQITKLAQRLNVSRGSFYWHFTDRKDLLQSLLAEWRAANSAAVETELANAPSLTQGILAFFSLWEDQVQFDPKLEQAIRDWARLDRAVMDIVHEEDNKRIATIATLFRRFEYEGDEAMIRARVLYFAQIGYHAMHMEEVIDERLAMLGLYFETFTGRSIDEKAAAGFIVHQGSKG